MNNALFSKHKLPICDTPIVTSGLIGLQYSMFQAYHLDLTPILINHYINVSRNVDLRAEYSHIYDDNWLCNENVMQWHHMTWSKDMFINRSEEILNILLGFINNNYYVFGHYNAYYIASEHAYKNYNTKSHYLIYGYDLNKKVLLSIGYTKNNVFEKYYISFDEYINSIMERTDNCFNWNFVKYNNNFEIKTNFKAIYNGIFDYINSANKGDGILLSDDGLERHYGLSCYKDFSNLIETQYKFRFGIDPNGYKILMEHHILMQVRIDYLIKCGALMSSTLSENYAVVCELSKNIYHQCKKYNIDHSPERLKYMNINVQKIIEIEQNVLVQVMNELKKHVSNLYLI